MLTITMVEFDQWQWEAFAGAERGEDGTLPHSNVGEVFVDGELVVVVADNQGVSIYDAEDCDGKRDWHLHLPGQIHLALFIARNLLSEAIGDDHILSPSLKKLGFTQ